MKRVILFGGSFDPIHKGHIMMAQRALEQRDAKELWFIPNQVSPFKTEATSFANRLAMIDLILDKDSRLKVIDIEGQKEGPSYTIDTVLELKKQYPDVDFDFLIGDDHIDLLHDWKNFKQLEKEIQFIVYGRSNKAHSYPVVKGEILNVSSTSIRKGESTDTDPKVLKYMVEHSLYTDSILKNRLSEYRYQHTVRVNQLALAIASYHQVDLNKVHIASMWHDFAKEDENLKDYVAKNISDCLSYPFAFYHAFVAADILKNKYHYDDEAVLDAIHHHVDGSSNQLLAKILYIADKCEPNRPYDSSEFIDLSKTNLDLAFEMLKKKSRKVFRRFK